MKSAATITIKDAPRMTKRGRKAIANWLRMHARYLEKHGAQYTKGRFIGRYLHA